MHFEPNTIYHVYNQGNNRQRIFFKPKNYYYFLEKMQRHLLPFVEILCYCLMPNHFHWLLYTRPEACQTSEAVRPRRYNERYRNLPFDNQQALSQAIGILLSSYTRAINIQENRTGSLFRKATKAKNGWITGEVMTIRKKQDHRVFLPGNDYEVQCFHYIHQNPVRAGLVDTPSAWPFSSYGEYFSERRPSICNCDLTNALLGLGLPEISLRL